LTVKTDQEIYPKNNPRKRGSDGRGTSTWGSRTNGDVLRLVRTGVYNRQRDHACLYGPPLPFCQPYEIANSAAESSQLIAPSDRDSQGWNVGLLRLRMLACISR